MDLTRDQLAKTNVDKVRRDSTLFALFRKYATEDAKYLYASGKLPGGCFGCQFKTFFSKWRSYILNDSKASKSKTMSNSKKTYELHNEATKFYFDGNVLSNKSSDEDWLKWINYPIDEAKVKQRKSYFKKLPKEVSESKDDTAKDKSSENVKNVDEPKEVSEPENVDEHMVGIKPKSKRSRKK